MAQTDYYGFIVVYSILYFIGVGGYYTHYTVYLPSWIAKGYSTSTIKKAYCVGMICSPLFPFLLPIMCFVFPFISCFYQCFIEEPTNRTENRNIIQEITTTTTVTTTTYVPSHYISLVENGTKIATTSLPIATLV
jgi:hypothetical protein